MAFLASLLGLDSETMSNSEEYPEAWAFYIEEARNIMDVPELNELGNYRIPVPDRSGTFFYADEVTELWLKFIKSFYEVRFNSESVYGKIQYIVQNLNH